MPRNKQETVIRARKNKSLQSPGGCKAALCCSCRISVSSSSDEPESNSGNSSDRFRTISSIAHALVQERLDDMIRERQEESANMRNIYEDQRMRRSKHHHHLRRRHQSREETKFVVMMVAVERASYDPREDFRRSMEEMIVMNKMRDVKDLRRLLDYYVQMNSEEFRGVILEVFYDVCTDLFLRCRWQY